MPPPQPAGFWESYFDRFGIVAGPLVLAMLAYIGWSVLIPGPDPLLAYTERDHPVSVRADEGCLVYRRDIGGRSPDEVLTYCPARKPEGAHGWAPQTRETFVLDPSGRFATELIAFGLLPDGTVTVRYTLPGGHVIEAPTQAVPGLDHPAVLLHLRDARLPVDLAEVGGQPVMAGVQLLDASGQEIDIV
ncbi:hypothetical protein [Catellatospora vulcania]|uniref:hypothetical protein n=1 Tax=Catellatospora vulcania TaxID=1460450 RepID=UPI0012D3BCDB|nr:hypothetical protein [Catellatospora vulcania]